MEMLFIRCTVTASTTFSDRSLGGTNMEKLFCFILQLLRVLQSPTALGGATIMEKLLVFCTVTPFADPSRGAPKMEPFIHRTVLAVLRPPSRVGTR